MVFARVGKRAIVVPCFATVISSEEDAALWVLSPFQTAVMLYVFTAVGDQTKENDPL